MELSEFLLARIAEDEALAGPRPERVTYFGAVVYDPARVLAECDAKRRLVADYREAVTYYEELHDVPAGEVTGLEKALKFLALPYADHADYRDEWKP